METSAVLSQDRRYRYLLRRTWDDELPTLAVIGLNPSTADETADDPTSRRCVGFARDRGFGSLLMVNLFALRATDPDALILADDRQGPKNLQHLRAAVARSQTTLAAWGAHRLARLHWRDTYYALGSPRLHCLGRTQDGAPRHPLYVRADQLFIPFTFTNS